MLEDVELTSSESSSLLHANRLKKLNIWMKLVTSATMSALIFENHEINICLDTVKRISKCLAFQSISNTATCLLQVN